MQDATLSWWGAFPMATALVLMVHHYWRQPFDTDQCPAFRALLVWTAKGVALPFAVWIALNVGIFPGVPILLPEVAILKGQGGPWFRFMLAESAPALFVTASFWTAVTLVSLLPAVVSRCEDPKDLKIHAGFWSLFLLPLSAVVVLAFGWWGAGAALVAWLAPIIQVSLTATQVAKRPPSYGAALAKLNFGNYPDAEQEILRELEKCEDDFDGWMMLANLYANKFDDLPEADRMIRELCGQPNVSGIQTSLALHRLADWHLKRGDDPASARSALEEICLRLPGTHFARMARQRIDQLPANREELIEQRTPKMIRLPALNDDLDDSPPARPADSNRREAEMQADRCVERLKRNPNDAEARENFATILAERLGEADLAIEQLDLLLAMPDQPVRKSAEWLARSAAWQIKYRQDPAAARVRLEQLMREFPQTPQAFAAQRRLNLMEMEERFRKARSTG